MAKTKKAAQTIVVMELPISIEALIPKVNLFILNVTNNALMFTSLIPTAVEMTTLVGNLVTSEAGLKGGTVNSSVRDGDLIDLLNAVNNWGGQVQIIVRTTVGLTAQNIIIQAFGARAKVNGVFNKPLFSGVNNAPGAVLIKKKRVPGATNEYQISYDGGVTWIGLVSTHLSEMTINGLALDSTPMFRTRANVGLTPGVWLTIQVTIEK